jgi:hypothetical protein
MTNWVTIVASLRVSWDAGSAAYVGRFPMVPTRANRQPAVAAYVRRPDDCEHRPFAIAVLRITGGRIAEITAFHDPGLFPAFDLPTALPPDAPMSFRAICRLNGFSPDYRPGGAGKPPTACS